MDVSGFSALTPAEQREQREYLRILEKMTTKQTVVTPGKSQGGMSEAAKRFPGMQPMMTGQIFRLSKIPLTSWMLENSQVGHHR